MEMGQEAQQQADRAGHDDVFDSVFEHGADGCLLIDDKGMAVRGEGVLGRPVSDAVAGPSRALLDAFERLRPGSKPALVTIETSDRTLCMAESEGMMMVVSQPGP
ncbi:Ragulator complex protein LAMTOR5 [Plasmodiophora brassicae]